MKLSLDQAEQYVAKTPNCRWDNYTICIFNKDAMAEFNPNGVRVSGQWGFEKRVDCDASGTWTL